MSEATAFPRSPETGLDGPTAMQRDLDLLLAGKAAFRIYTWEGVWVTLGRNQNPEDVLVDPGNTNWIKRPTGGAAVLHGHDVTVGLVLPLKAGSVVDTYRTVTESLIKALNELGIPACLAADIGVQTSNPLLADCFATVSKNDIVDPGSMRKICGCALRRTRDAVLLQASIPVQAPTCDPSSIILHGVQTFAIPVAAGNLSEALGQFVQV